jgi:hypothetical protein
MLGFWWARSGVDVNAAHAVLSDNGTLVATFVQLEWKHLKNWRRKKAVERLRLGENN